MLSEALRYPLGPANDRGAAAEALATGGGLHLLAAIVAPLWPLTLLSPVAIVAVVGYLVRVLGAAGDADDPVTLPTFRRPLSLLRDGLVASAVSIAVLLVPVVVLLVTVGGAVSGAAGGGPVDPTTPLGYGVTLVGGTVSLLLAVGIAYPLPAILAGYARADPAGTVRARVAAGISSRSLRRTVTSGRYFYAWTVGAVLLAFGAALAGAGSRTARLVGFFGLFYLEVAAAAAWSRGIGGNR
ncbi:DUF4013 domain-containing protein [Halobaculum roseum]|uniref:DUF4013 domain-containing protein n=1 Tax=Halobaculum roseum TaxID=2175149 RepID=A0ABD5MMP7_9EURY|nr:DUF4013 domain-containing protein [Halobaculum roseum]QZY02981.1 DUF4013 domain-containing protein [Halobaculum roseum]